MPAAFVLIWATGFVVARLVAPHASPLFFLSLRYVLAIVALSAIALAGGARWPRTARAIGQALVTGALMQGLYLGGVFWSVRHGLSAGIAALVAGLQPLLTAALAGPLLHERVGARRWGGIVLGLAGALLVLLPNLTAVSAPVAPVAVCLMAMAAMTAGTIWQKRTGMGADVRTHLVVQFAGALVATLPIAAVTETMHFDLSLDAWTGLLWAALGLSVGANVLLLLLIRRGAVSGVASLLYLVPPVSALMAFALFGERLALVQMAGMALAAVGVAVASRAVTARR